MLSSRCLFSAHSRTPRLEVASLRFVESFPRASAPNLFIIVVRSCIISPSAWVTTPKINRSYSFTSLPYLNTLKIDLIRCFVVSEGPSTYLGHVDFFDNQLSFDSVFGNDSTMFRITRRSADKCDIDDTANSVEN